MIKPVMTLWWNIAPAPQKTLSPTYTTVTMPSLSPEASPNFEPTQAGNP
jgi:hypothetical protein